MATVSVTDDNFDSEVLKSSKPIVVDFGQNGVAHANRLVQV